LTFVVFAGSSILSKNDPRTETASSTYLGDVVKLHAVRALHDVHLLVFAGRAFEQLVAHPFAAGLAARDDLQRLRQENLGHIVGVVRNDLIEAARGRPARGGRILCAGAYGGIPRPLRGSVRGVFFIGARGILVISAPSASAVLASDPFTSKGMASTDLTSPVKPFRNIRC
jgi:hypothetical protein